MEGLPHPWKNMLAATLLGVAAGGGGSTAIYSLGPGAEFARQVQSNADSTLKLTQHTEFLIRAVDTLSAKIAALDEDQDKGTSRIAILENNLEHLRNTTGAELATIRALLTENLARIDREIAKLADQMQKIKEKG